MLSRTPAPKCNSLRSYPSQIQQEVVQPSRQYSVRPQGDRVGVSRALRRLRAWSNRIVVINEVSSLIRIFVTAIRTGVREVVGHFRLLGEKIVREAFSRDFGIRALGSTILALQNPAFCSHGPTLLLSGILDIPNKLEKSILKNRMENSSGTHRSGCSLMTLQGSLSSRNPANFEWPYMIRIGPFKRVNSGDDLRPNPNAFSSCSQQ
jgi:hypothetical protein